MSVEHIHQRLRELLRQVRRQAPHERLSPHDPFAQALGLDSLDVGNFIIEVENEFSVRLGLAGLEELTTLEKLANFVVEARRNARVTAAGAG